MRSGLMSASTMMEMGFDDDMEMDVDVDVAAVLRKVGGRAAKERAGRAVEARRRMAAADLAIMSRGGAGLWGGRSAQSRPAPAARGTRGRIALRPSGFSIISQTARGIYYELVL